MCVLTTGSGEIPGRPMLMYIHSHYFLYEWKHIDKELNIKANNTKGEITQLPLSSCCIQQFHHFLTIQQSCQRTYACECLWSCRRWSHSRAVFGGSRKSWSSLRTSCCLSRRGDGAAQRPPPLAALLKYISIPRMFGRFLIQETEHGGWTQETLHSNTYKLHETNQLCYLQWRWDVLRVPCDWKASLWRCRCKTAFPSSSPCWGHTQAERFDTCCASHLVLA